jgi:hypothetical protein
MERNEAESRYSFETLTAVMRYALDVQRYAIEELRKLPKQEGGDGPAE